MSIHLFETTLNLTGLIIGAAAFMSIALGRYLTIQAEYYFSKKFWRVFLALGIILVVCALFTDRFMISAILSILGFTFLWGIGEIIEQGERVRKGWFPENPRKKRKSK